MMGVRPGIQTFSLVPMVFYLIRHCTYMKPEAQQQQLLACLLDGPATSDDLRRELGGVSPATLSRLMARLGSQSGGR